MPDNSLAPPNMPWLWQPNSPVGQPNGLGPPMLNYAAPPNPAAPTVGQGVAQTAADVAQALPSWPSVEEQRRMLQPLPGWQGTAVDAAKQWAEGVMMGTTAPGDVPPPGIVAYHGSPHSFDRFDTSKIGTGEGAQAYGHGLYFAGNEGVANTYKGAGPAANAQLDAINTQLSQLSRQMDQYSTGQYGKYSDPKGYELKAQYDALMDQRAKLGHMYEVNIGADPEHFLDWDKPLSEQHPVVQDVIGKLGIAQNYKPETVTGEYLARSLGSSEGAQQLREAGIPGIRYLDQGSRGAGQGTHNYVVFDPATIEILRKYGIAGLIAGGGAAAAGTQQQQPSQ